MVSLFIAIAGVVGSLLLPAWVMALAARAVGSTRGRLRVGLLVMAAILGIVMAIIALSQFLHPSSPGMSVALSLFLFLIESWLIFRVMQRLFALNRWRTFVPFGAYIGCAIVQFAIAMFVVRPWICEAFALRSDSMAPTIAAGDRVLANKLIRPRRLDIIVYRTRVPDGGMAVYCKRLVGLPGERLRFESGNLYVNDVQVALPPAIAGRCHISPAGVERDRIRYVDGETIQLGNDECFVIGDNLDRSLDSRLLGPSQFSSLIGVVDLEYWPAAHFRVLR